MTTLLVEAAAAWALNGREDSGHRLGDILRGHRSLVPQAAARGRDVDLVRLLLDTDGSLPAADFVSRVGETTGMRGPGRTIDREETKSYQQLAAYVGRGTATVAHLASRALRSDRVVVTTMSSSKGLEFDSVVIVGANGKQMPDFRSSTQAQLDEDRRKLYVSLTRARDTVDIYWSGQVQWKTNLDHTGPSPFLHQLGLL